MKKLTVHNLGLKLVSLALAILTWFYIIGELGKVKVIEEKSPMELAYSYRLKVKHLPIRPNFQGTTSAGYMVDEEKVDIKPKTHAVWGPGRIVESLEYLQTKPIGVGEYTKSFTVKVGLQPVANLRLPKNDFIVLKVPIVKKEQ